MRHVHSLSLAHRRHKSAQPARRHIVRMPFELVRLFENPLRIPAELPKVHRQRDRGQSRCRRRAASHPQRNPVRHPDRKRHDRPLVIAQDLLVGLDNQVVFEPRTAIRIAPGGGN